MKRSTAAEKEEEDHKDVGGKLILPSLAWEKYTVPKLEFTDFSANKFELKKWKGSSWSGNGTTIKTISSEEMKHSVLISGDEGNGNTYGFQLVFGIKGFPVGYDTCFGYILILPNGDEYVGSWGFPELKKNYTWVSMNEAFAFYEIYQAYGYVPTGTYKLIATINGYIVDNKEFDIVP